MRRRMLSDTVYVTFHDALKAWYKEGKTHLTPQEICLSAKNLCDVILGLPDAQEGIDDELEDLEEEASCITEVSGDVGAAADAMLIEMVAASMLVALSAKQGQASGKILEKSNSQSVILCIMKRWCHHELFDALLDEGCKKEEARFAEGKRADLLHYELMEWKREEGENPDAMRQFINQLLTPV